MGRRGLPHAPRLEFTESTKVDRPQHDCTRLGHLWKKTETIWPGETAPRLTQTCTVEGCGLVMGRTIK